jgi:hypothetical protein
MANLEWFYINQWKAKQVKKLQENNRIEVHWDDAPDEADLPRTVQLPFGLLDEAQNIHHINELICRHVLSKYGYSINWWQVASREKNES